MGILACRRGSVAPVTGLWDPQTITFVNQKLSSSLYQC